MANLTAVTAAHAKLTANAIDTVTLTGRNGSVGDAYGVKVTNETNRSASGAAPIYVSVTAASPTVSKSDTYVVNPGTNKVFNFTGTIKLISSGAPNYSVVSTPLSDRLKDALEDEIMERRLADQELFDLVATLDPSIGDGSDPGEAASSTVTQLDSNTYQNTVSPSDLVAIPLSGLSAGDIVVIHGFGEILNNTGDTRNFAPTLRVGSTTDGGTASAIETSANPSLFSVDVHLVVSATSIQSDFVFSLNTPSGTKRWSSDQNFTVDLTQTTQFSVIGTLSAALPTLSMKLTGGYWSILDSEPLLAVREPLFFTNYASVPGALGSTATAPPWQNEQEPVIVSPDPGGEEQRLEIIPTANVPGSNSDPYKPLGPAYKAFLKPYSKTNPGTSDPADGDVQGGTFSRAESYARNANNSSLPATQWPDPLGSVRWYGFTCYFEPGFNFATDTTWMSIRQLKGQRLGSPPVAIEVKRQNLRLGGTRTNNGSSRPDLGIIPGDGILTPIVTGQWYKVVLGVKQGISINDGWVNVYVNDIERIGKTNVSTVDEVTSGDPDQYYWKGGIYKSHAWTLNHRMYYSDDVIGERKIDVDTKLATVLRGA